ncbi:OsmC family protein [Aequorivita sp. H23M31]|uniref:OsmC family protein n=1 Tax=Aequorivita ciconiae TaxID=2494375 RepID=A0A451FSG6_9FLAO|nr:bifunctional alpha/beta hydrolase/OsmC family protein [Aequorivita sp. H23M31]QAA80357.1 OsmC family protein [Aequorivita sp. H23M31]
MKIEKVTFKNKNEEKLAGRLELPINRKPHNLIVFAHCFTCTKNLTAIKNIGRALIAEGFGVLRFDFTGLGESEGDFENTNFSGNVADLLEASQFLEKHYQAPTLLIGHSLGGAAAIFAAAQISSIKAVAVINSPSQPSHLTNLLRSSTSEINEKGKAKINLGGMDFTIKKQFLDDLKNKPLQEIVGSFNKAILILHSPVDKIVNINNAEDIYKAAKHPKSFVSLDTADHMLSKREDSEYVGKVIASWASRYVEIPDEKELRSNSHVAASLDGDQKFTTQLKLGRHSLIADEPAKFGGNEYGPTPYDYVSGGLAACTALTIQMYARRKEWQLENVTVNVDYSKDHVIDCENCEDPSAKIDSFSVGIKLEGNLSEKQKHRLIEIGSKCPVHKTLTSNIQVLVKRMD